MHLVPPPAATGDADAPDLRGGTVRADARTASGSRAVDGAKARVARASRILVEGKHDAELVEKVWGDDLRIEGVVVELLDGVDHLDDAIRAFAPGRGRRLGVLVDHLVPGSKEARIAAAVRDPNVLVLGTPFVDIWAAIRPKAAGIDAWPDIPMGTPWKEGICAALGVGDPPASGGSCSGRVQGWGDLDQTLVAAVEQLIDFVTAPADAPARPDRPPTVPRRRDLRAMRHRSSDRSPLTRRRRRRARLRAAATAARAPSSTTTTKPARHAAADPRDQRRRLRRAGHRHRHPGAPALPDVQRHRRGAGDEPERHRRQDHRRRGPGDARQAPHREWHAGDRGRSASRPTR